jgi:hypothetical protein
MHGAGIVGFIDLRPERSQLRTAAMSRLLSIHHDDCRHARPPRISKSPWPGWRPRSNHCAPRPSDIELKQQIGVERGLGKSAAIDAIDRGLAMLNVATATN